MKDLKRLFGYMGPYKRDMALGMLLVVIESAFEMVIPILMSDIIDEGVAIEEKLFGSCFESEDQRNGMAAFLNKEKAPAFQNK